MKAQEIIQNTRVEDHSTDCGKGCFSLVSIVDFLECEIFINNDGQHGCEVWLNEEPVVLSNDVIEELYNYLNREADEIEKPSDYRDTNSGPDMMELAKKRKLERIA